MADFPDGIADLGGEVAEDQHRGVAELLELAELAQHDGESEVDVGRGGVDAELHPQRAAWRACAGSSASLMTVDRAPSRIEVGRRGAMTLGTLPGRRARAPAHIRVSGDDEAPRMLVAPPGRQAHSRGDPRRGRRWDAVVEHPHRASHQVGVVERSGDPERLAQAGRAGAELATVTPRWSRRA